MRKVNILAIGAHPDDIEFGCGGSLIKYTRKGHRLSLLVMTGGGGGGPADERMTEQAASKEVLGAEEIFWGGFEDTRLPADIDMIRTN
jgi:LmbE family N-acetylglucosaminyl deacetylase